MEKIKNAILIHGPGRSGTTLLSSILSLHEDLGWISGYVNKFPEHTYLAQLNKIQGSKEIEKWNRNKKKYPRPSEAYNFWLHYVPEFNNENIEQVSQESANRTIKAINSILKHTSKERFITKITGKSRYQTIDAIFDNPKVIWIDRNPKSIVTSYYKLKWNYKHRLDQFAKKSKMDLLKEYAMQYLSFEADKKELLKYDIQSFQYEKLVENPELFFKEICDFTDLSYSNNFERIVNSWDIKKGTNSGYKKYLNEEEENYLEKLLKI